MVTLRWLISVATIGLLVTGVLLLTTWEVELFRATTADRDFTGLTCGTPLDNPGWRTGTPCHGAVNRQTAGAVLALGSGLQLAILVIVTLVVSRRPRRPVEPDLGVG